MSTIFPVFEGDGGTNLPRYPTVNDMGGLQFEDDPKYPPREGKRLRAENYMQLIMAADRVCRMIPPLVIEFAPGYTGYTPTEPAIISVTSVIDAITIDTVSVSRVSVGLYRILYPQNTLPPKRQLAQAWGCESDSLGSYAVQGNGYVDVHVYNQGGSLTDDPQFKTKVRMFGE